MSIDPTHVIAEILGQPSSEMRDPAAAAFQCPFTNSECSKTSQKIEGKYPVCTIRMKKDDRPICVCPKRFFEADFLKDVLKHCWHGEPPENPQIAHEVKMSDFGQVDFVIADIDADSREVRNFVSVELQAIDITGSVMPAYQAVLGGINPLSEPFSYGGNWANVRKRYINQLINKGFFHHHWRTPIVSVIQEPLYERFRESIAFDELDPKSRTANVVFMLYDYVSAPEKGDGGLKLEFQRAVGTSHNSLMTAALYKTPPPKAEFCRRILDRLQ